MNNITEKIFEVLGIKPNEKFKIKEDNSGDSYYLDEDLSGYCVERDNSLVPFNASFLQDILRGKVKIVKLPTKEDKIIIDYAKLCGFKWIAVNQNSEIVISRNELERYDVSGCWQTKDIEDSEEYMLGKLSFLTWEDEPYYIGKEGE